MCVDVPSGDIAPYATEAMTLFDYRTDHLVIGFSRAPKPLRNQSQIHSQRADLAELKISPSPKMMFYGSLQLQSPHVLLGIDLRVRKLTRVTV